MEVKDRVCPPQPAHLWHRAQWGHWASAAPTGVHCSVTGQLEASGWSGTVVLTRVVKSHCQKA